MIGCTVVVMKIVETKKICVICKLRSLGSKLYQTLAQIRPVKPGSTYNSDLVYTYFFIC